jgi:antitoxin component of RelBE/YafQ-DinJ toxin-antitoxin module
LSDAIRLYLQQVVLQEGIPFSISAEGRVNRVPAEQLWEMKRSAQARDHESAATADLSSGKRMLIRPHQLRGAKVKWSSAKLSD